MAESAKLLVDDVLKGYPIRQWVLSLPIPLRLLLARYPNELSKVLQIIHRAISTVSYRIAVGADTGKKVFTLQTMPAKDPDNLGQLAKISGFSLHAEVFADSHQPDKLERLCRYISRSAISEERLSLTSHSARAATNTM